MDESATIVTHENEKITNSNTFPTDNKHNITFPDQRICKITKRVYISFTLESELNLSQIKYGSRYNSSGEIIETLCVNLVFLKMEKYNSQKEASIGFFLGVNPKLTLRKALKQKIDEMCLWLDLDDEDTKKLIRETTTESNTTQELVILSFDPQQRIRFRNRKRKNYIKRLRNPNFSRQRSHSKKYPMQSIPSR